MEPDLWTVIDAQMAILSYSSQIQYKQAINFWIKSMGGAKSKSEKETKILAATKTDALRFITFLKSRTWLGNPLSTGTINLRITLIRRIYKILGEAGFVQRNPFFGIDLKRFPKASYTRPNDSIDTSIVFELLNKPSRFTTDGLRDRAMLALLFGGGLRSSELRNLTFSDMRYSSKGTFYVYLSKTKAGKPDIQVIPAWAEHEVRNYITRKNPNGQGDHLFTQIRRGSRWPMSADNLRKIFKFWCNECGIDNATVHWSRCTAITKLLDDGLSHRDVQTFSRHASVSMVEHYDKRRVQIDQAFARKLSYSQKSSC